MHHVISNILGSIIFIYIVDWIMRNSFGAQSENRTEWQREKKNTPWKTNVIKEMLQHYVLSLKPFDAQRAQTLNGIRKFFMQVLFLVRSNEEKIKSFLIASNYTGGKKSTNIQQSKFLCN